MDKCCRTCKHYYSGECLNEVVTGQLVEGEYCDWCPLRRKIAFSIRHDDEFFCSEWE